MEIGFVGLGRMGANMASRLREAGHSVVGFDIDPALSDVASLSRLVEALKPPRVVWVMLHASATEDAIESLTALLGIDDILVDGGNGHYALDAPRAVRLGKRGIGYLDVGVSGGIWGNENGYSLMVGGSAEHVQRIMPIFSALKPDSPLGFTHVGPTGSGHYAKMVHNGIEYGMMQAYAEGYELLSAAGLVPDAPSLIKSWREGSAIRSWLLDLLDRALDADPELAKLQGVADDTGEGRWMVEEGVRLAVPLPAITASLYARFSSRQSDAAAMKVVAALRQQFGGHTVTDAAGAS